MLDGGRHKKVLFVIAFLRSTLKAMYKIKPFGDAFTIIDIEKAFQKGLSLCNN